ncbi:hypothetical protein AVL61_12020 [Kocuria rosea subsp. polaris]|uniref:Uncharacterized protein n=1 Tax=Kocuria rosea subsp. polaris TaxID=136273 RepID=A0A0W8I4K2_KOCRO|nr:hypothetical protein AVL61_12020 [Kocuria polaris]
MQRGPDLDRLQTAVDGAQAPHRWAETTFWPARVLNQNRPYPSSLIAPSHHQQASGVGPLSTWA